MNKEVDKVLGGINVRLCNKANVYEAFLNDIFSKCELDNRELLLLILDDKNRFEHYGNIRRAGATTKDIIINDGLYRRDMEEIIELKKFDECDVVLYVPKKTTDKWGKYKPYFAFVLGHELEHVKVIRENVKFHMCATWLFDNNDDIFVKAGIDCKSMKTWNFPLEFHCNKKGKKLALDLFGKEEFDECFNILMGNETQKHKEYLAFIMDELEGEPYAVKICESLCCDIRAYYNERSKKAAHGIWKMDKSDGNLVAKQFDLEEFIPLN